MALMDEFKDERAAMKERPLRDRLKYFVDYYKWHVLGGLAALIFVCWFGYDIISAKDIEMYGIMVNGSIMEVDSQEKFETEFAEYAEIDTKKCAVKLDHEFRMQPVLDQNGLNTSQTIMAYMAAGDLDCLLMSEFIFSKYTYHDSFLDLRTLLSEEMLAQYKDHIFYMDRAFLEEMERITKEETLSYGIEYPAYTDPDALEDPVPVGIALSASGKFGEYYTFGDEKGFIGIVANTKNPDICVKLFEYFFPTK